MSNKDAPGPTYMYSSQGKQIESKARSMPSIEFGSSLRPTLDAMTCENGKVIQQRRTHTDFYTIEARHVDCYKKKATSTKFPGSQRKNKDLVCSPGPIYGLKSGMGSGPAYSPGTSQRERKAFGDNSDFRGYNEFASLGARQGNSLRRSARQSGWGKYSSRSAPVMGKLDKNW